jgi:hypothetical protein
MIRTMARSRSDQHYKGKTNEATGFGNGLTN